MNEHLLLASFIIPRLVLAKLASWQCYELTLNDRREFRAIDRLLKLQDLFAERADSERWLGFDQWAWLEAFKVAYTQPNPDGPEEDSMWGARPTRDPRET